MKQLFAMLALFFSLALLFSAIRENAAAQTDSRPKSYATEPDWNDPQRLIPLNFQQARGQRLFYQYCVWCHADATPAGPSNRANLSPVPPLLNDGAALNGKSDEFLRDIITRGGGALGKSAMMPPYGGTLTREEIRAVIAFVHAIAQPAFQPAAAR
ncbi:MAG: cytochrome c [Acidobacteriia bacterium]|nr:cytochrome c [Terriglobia bacterium]